MIQGDWKLVALADGPWELYHLGEDATETRNLTDRQPQRVAEMADEWQSWAKRVGAGRAESLPAGEGNR